MKAVKELIFEEGKDFTECHASTIVALQDGSFVCAWFAGTKEGHDDVAIWQSRRCDGKWSKPVKVADSPQEDIPSWNPVLFIDQNILYLFYRTGKTVPKWQSWVKHSTDGGITYSEAELLPEGVLGPIKNKPIRMSNGKWLAGSSVEAKNEWYCRMEVYCPASKSWESSVSVRFKVAPDSNRTKNWIGIIQPSVWESSGGEVHAILRSNNDCLYRTDSTDFGKTWSDPFPIEVPNPNSGIDLTKLPNGRLVLACNPVPADKENYNWGPRSPLSLLISDDNGKTWPTRKDIEVGKITKEDGGYSYPAIIPYDDGITLIYSWHLRNICFQTIPQDELA